MTFEKQIDFSCMHNILIRNPDGSLQPMDEPFFESELIAPGTWMVLSDGDYSYLVEGGDEAIVIDTGYGAGNIREYCQTLTTKPIINVANTHYHFDHTACNGYFDAALMSADTAPLATVPYKSFEGIEFITDYKRVIIRNGDCIDLGSRKLEVLEIPCHAVGSLAFLDRARRIMFTGDEFGPSCNLGGSIGDFIQNMEKLTLLRGEFDVCYGGGGAFDASYVEKCLALAKDIITGTALEAHGWDSLPSVKGEPAPEGVTVYMRKCPRPGDGGAGKDHEFKRIVYGYGVRLMYDTREV